MNILEAYIQQYGFFNVLFSSVDYELLKEIVLNLCNDFNAEFIDLFPIMINIEDIDDNRVKDLTSTQNKTRFIIVPTFPYKYVKLKTSFHINISLNYKLISERKIKKEYLDLEDKYKETTKVDKFINLSKYLDDTNKLENEIFNVLISRINKKLDNGNYQKRLKNSSSESTNNTFTSDDFTTDKLVSKKYNHDVKEKYLEKKNEIIDEDIMNDISDSEIDPYEDINTIELEDVNMDDKIIPVNDFSSMEPFELYNQDGGLNEIVGKRVIKKKIILFGKRKLNKKMK